MTAGPNQALGAYGEQRAVEWYEQHGFTVVVRNWRSPTNRGEIDLVLRNGRTLVICEVKARSSDRFGLPVEAITPAKQRRLRHLGMEYLTATNPGPCDLRFDVVSVLGGAVEVIEGAF